MKLTQEQKKEFNKIGQKYHLELITLHGSRVSKNVHRMSDFDVAILKDKDLTSTEYSNLLSNFCGIFQVKEDKIDISELKNASSLLLKEIADSAICLYSKKDDSFINFYLKAYKQFIDDSRIYKFEDAYLKNRYLNKRPYAQQTVGKS